MLRRPEPGTFEHLLTTVSVPVAHLVRLSMSGSTEPYWSRRAKYRFDDPSEPKDKRFGVLYVADDLRGAFCESVIHEGTLFRSGRYEVALSEFDRREVTNYKHPKRAALTVVDLTDAALKKVGLNGDISSGDDYEVPQLWSKAIHDALPDAQGLRYISRQLNGVYCYAVFERSSLLVHAWRSLTASEKGDLANEFNVFPV